MTDTAKIIADARKISELVVSQSEALTAYVTAAHATADAILLLAGEIEEEAGGDASGLPEFNIHDAETVREGEVIEFRVTLSQRQTALATVQYRSDLIASLPGTVTIAPGDDEAVIQIHASGAGYSFTVELFDPVNAILGDAVATGTILPADGNGNGNGGNPVRPIEPVNSSLHQVTLTVAGDAPTHVWDGAGTGLNNFDGAHAVFERVRTHRAKLDRIGMHVLRIFTPNAKMDCVRAYKPYFDLFRPRLVAASGFIYRSGGPVRNNIRALAEGVKFCIDQGLRIDIATGQNEPDGHAGNKPRDGSYADHQRWLREDLDNLGLQHVKVATLEWRHPPNGGIPEFDQLKAAGLIGKGKAVEIGCGHVYDKTQGLDLGDRLRSVGITWSSWETGNNGSGCSSVARALSAANLGSAFDCLHYVMVTTPTPNSEQMGQAFLDFNGNPRPWTPHWEVAFGRALVPESVIYRCSSSDRAPGMPSTMDQWMVRNAAVSGGRNPRLNVVIAKRKDGKTAIVATNTTHGTDGFSPYTGGHYGQLNQQHSLRVPWLAGKDGSFQVWRASPEGAVSGPQVVGMDDGLVRWSINGAWTVGLVGGAA